MSEAMQAAQATQAAEAAGTDVAGTLGEFWQELLGVDAVGSDDHLLELGGNSLVATMLANRIEFAWGVRPTMGTLMTSSFSELCAWCEQSRRGASDQESGQLTSG